MNVRMEQLGLRYGSIDALKDVTLELTDGKIYGLLGRNGAGKTSLLSIMASFREQTTGTITINGKAPFENAEMMQQVACMYDKDYSDDSDNAISILEGVELFRPHFDMDYAQHLIGQFKLDKEKPVKSFSKGMQSALNVIIGLAGRTPITIFDEVYLGMDAPSREIFYKELIEDQERYPRMIILSTHLVSEMDYLFDEVIILDHGKILLQEPYDSLISKGAAITGHADIVDEFVQAKQQINVKHLGQTKSVTVYGELSLEERNTAENKGLEVAPVSLQDLFIHLTEEGGESHETTI